MTQSPNTSMSGSTNTTISSTNAQCLTTTGCSTNMTRSQVHQSLLGLLCPLGKVCIDLTVTRPILTSLGDTFTLNVLVTNNSPNAIFYHDLCLSPITADFDNHVAVQSKIGCLITDTLSIPAGHSAWVKGPASNTVYGAVKAAPLGDVTSIVTFTYHTNSIAGPTHSVSKGFTYVIFGGVHACAYFFDNQDYHTSRTRMTLCYQLNTQIKTINMSCIVEL
jgi:hypothetical protein